MNKIGEDLSDDRISGQGPDAQTQLEIKKLEQERAMEHQRDFLARWNIDVGRLNSRALEAYKSSVAFAQSGLRSTILMNGGALVALARRIDGLASGVRFATAVVTGKADSVDNVNRENWHSI